MAKIKLEHQEPVSVDEATKAAIAVGLASLERGEGVPAEQIKDNVRKKHKEWLKSQKEAILA